MPSAFRPAPTATASAVAKNLDFLKPAQFHAPVPYKQSSVVIPSNLDRDRVDQVRQELRKVPATEFSTIAVPKNTSAAQDELLKMAKANDIDILETKFSEVIKLAKGVDLTSLSKPSTGLWAKVKNKFTDVREEVIKAHTNANDQIERVFAAVGTNAKAIAARVPLLEQIHQDTQQEYIDLDYLIAAGKLELEDRTSDLEQLKQQAQADSANIKLQSSLQEAQFNLQQLEIGVSNWERDQQMAFNTLPQVRLMQTNALTMSQTFQTIQGSVLPNWKKQFALTLAGNEQKRAAQLQNKVLDMNNELAISNAVAVRQTTNEVMRANQRGTYDLSTLERVHNETIGTFEDAFKLAQEGRTQRAQITTRVAEMKQQMVEKFSV